MAKNALARPMARIEISPQAAEPKTREVMDIRQASAYLGVSADSLYRYASEGTVPAFRLGNRWRFKKSRLDHWMDEQSSPPETAQKTGNPRQKKPVRSAS